MPPETRGEAVRAATARLSATSETPRLDAELLMAHALGITRDALLLGGLHHPMPPHPFVPSAVEGRAPGEALAARTSTTLGTNGRFEGPVVRHADGESATNGDFRALVARRAAGEPIAYITGTRGFWDMELRTTPAVLIPRPDSETLVEAAIAHFGDGPGPARVLDLGTGSGALLLAALRVWPSATGIGIDRSTAALAVARENAAGLGLAARAEMIAGGWAGTGAAFDLVLCNPPYIGTHEPLPHDVVGHEPHGALFAGEDGLDDYRALAPLLPAQIAPGGVACVEIGATQAGAVSQLFQACGLRASLRRDLAGRDRCLVLTR